jgi:hypothetical protein
MKVGIGLLFAVSLVLAAFSMTSESQRRSVAQSVGLPQGMAVEAERQLNVFISWAKGEAPKYRSAREEEEERSRDI